MRERGFHFSTRNGAIYYYDDLNGHVTPDNTHQIPREDEAEEGVPTHQTPSAEVAETRNATSSHLTAPKIARYLESEGLMQLILTVTESCNLRCRYCAYSGNYEFVREHQSTFMPWRVASQAIKWYLNRFERVKERNPKRIPMIGFYGGEPLLSLNLMKKAVVYARKLYHGDVLFNVTTNGTLLMEEARRFLSENQVYVTITLNGPQIEHDRMRTYSDGSGSFQVIWDNLMKLRETCPDYYYERCSIMVDYDAGTDLDLVHRFFETNREVLPTTIRTTFVSPYFTKWHEQYPIEHRRRLVDAVNEFKETYLSELMAARNPSSFVVAMAGGMYYSILSRPQHTLNPSWFVPTTGTCTPGFKISVDTQGNFHCCEKLNGHFPIGNVEVGLDIFRVARLLEMYREQVLPACIDCPITRLCPVCIAIVGADAKFERSPPDLCATLQHEFRRAFSEVWSWLEVGLQESDILSSADGRKG